MDIGVSRTESLCKTVMIINIVIILKEKLSFRMSIYLVYLRHDLFNWYKCINTLPTRLSADPITPASFIDVSSMGLPGTE